MLVRESHRGPLPSAKEFQRYDQALPGAADRILAMAEREQTHRHAIEHHVVTEDVRLKKRSPWFAFVALCAMLAVVGYIAYLGHPTSATALGGGVLIGVVALFLGQRWRPGGSDSEAEGEE